MTNFGLWGEEFSPTKEDVSKIIEKLNKPKVVKEVSLEKKLKSKNVSLEEKIISITDEVNRILGSYKDSTLVIKDYETFKKYIDASIEQGIIAIDTETGDEEGYGSLNTFNCNIMGLCLYTPTQKNAYVPVSHVNLETKKKLDWQITEQQICEQLKRLVDNNVKCVFHNATFDIEVILQTCGIKLNAYWDTMVGAQLLNENELKGLKTQYKLHCNNEQEKYDIEHLFQGLPYSIFNPELFALYAATDSKMTLDLYDYQVKEFEKEENKGIYDLLTTIEIPIISVIVDMELAGVEVDLEYAKKISEVYHGRLDEIQREIDEELLNLKPLIDTWKLTPEANAPIIGKTGKPGKSKLEQLSDPIDLGSPTQMAVLLYDIMHAPVVDKKKPRTTDSAALEVFSEEKHIKICELLLKKREVDILINSFIDKIPTIIDSDGRARTRFNQCGTQTGRFSSSGNFNIQQIPSHDKFVRMMFKAREGYSIIGGDFSGQEPRSLCSFAEDKDMQHAYAEKKDLYAVIASKCFHNDYTDNLEFHPVTHVQSQEGKARRSIAKTIFLGILYGMGAKSLSDRINMPLEEAQVIIDDFYKGFPGIKKFTEDSQEMLKKLGYVTDLFGRRRHIPDAQLPEYEIIPDTKYKSNYNFNPLLESIPHEDKLLNSRIKDYEQKLSKAKWKKDRDLISAQAAKDGLTIRTNTGLIARSLRQCLNARIQGSAASMTKLAMIMVANDEELNKYGFKLLVTVHDEVFGEVPTENADKAAQRLCQVMVDAAKIKCSFTPWSVDPYIVKRWYVDECASKIKEDYDKLCKKNSEDDAFNIVISKYPMIQEKYLRMMSNGSYDPNLYSDI